MVLVVRGTETDLLKEIDCKIKMALRLFKLRSIAAYAPELEVQGPQTLEVATAIVTTPTPEALENVGGKITDNEETVLDLLNYVAARRILKAETKINDTKPLNKEARKERDVEVLIKTPEKIRQSIREDEKDDTNDASKEDKSVSKEADEENVDTLSIKAKNRELLQEYLIL